MNLAFPALCIVLLVLPGILFRKTYARSALPFNTRRSREFAANKYPKSNLPLTEEIGVSLIAAIVLHVLWLSAWTAGSKFLELEFSPNYNQLLYLLYGGLTVSKAQYRETLDYLAEHHILIVTYFLSLYLFAGIAGRASLAFVRSRGLDHRQMFLRLEDHWFYFLSGEIFKFKEFSRFLPNPPKITGTYVSVVVSHIETDVLYKGFLWDFYLNRQGNLDRLLLHNVIRCKFDANGGKEITSGKNDDDTSGNTRIINRVWEFERISSQIFTVKYDDCKTLACTYFSINETPVEQNEV